MEETEVRHYQVNGRYRIIFERAAGIKSGDGFKVEANSDSIDEAENDAKTLYGFAKGMTIPDRVNIKEE